MHGYLTICCFRRMIKFMSTPLPFPLIQMTRTIVLFYVFSVPFVLLNDATADLLIEHCIVVFLITYACMGLEILSIELDDPFGNDKNTFE
jgi:predicted membrane chloride channel (bestrophin family)